MPMPSGLYRSPDGGASWLPMGSVRTTPGGLDGGQTDKSVSGKSPLAAAGVTVQLGAVPANRTWLFTDLFFQLDASNATVQLQVNGVTVWQGLAGLSPIGQARRNPVYAYAGQAVTLVWGAPTVGTPNGYHNLGIVEQ